MDWQRWRYVLPLRIRSIFRRSIVDRELDEELRFHLQCKVEEQIDRGLDAREAYYHALRAIGGLQQRKEEARDMRGVRWLSDFVGDLKYAVRTIGHSKLFTILAVLTLGLGIGATSAIFSLTDAMLLRPLPVLRPSEIVTLSNFSPKSSSDSMGPLSYRDYLDYRHEASSFEGLAAFSLDALHFGFASHAGQLPKLKGGLLVSGNLFRVMGVEPELGREFNSEEDRLPGRNAVVILGNEFWQSEFAGDRSVIGRHILLNGIDFSILGVAPRKFTGLDQYVRPDVFVPIMMWPRLFPSAERNPLEDRTARELVVKGRVKPGVSIAQARAQAGVIARNLQNAYPKTNRNVEAAVRTEFALRVQTDPSEAALAGVLLALAGAVLLIACANVAGLLLGRARTRSREIAVRLAIGAGRFRLVRLLLAESVVIAFAGGVIGIALGYGGIEFFRRYQIPTDMPIRLTVQLDKRVFLLSLAVSLLSAVVAGLAPALQTTRTDAISALKMSEAEIPGRRLWGRNTLVICQVAASLALLTAALQMVRTFDEKWRNGPGFRTDHLLTMTFDPQLARYSEAQTQRFYKDLVRRVRLFPGVKSAALTGELPMANDEDFLSLVPEGYQMPAGKESFGIGMNVADESYFQTLGVQLLRGRGFRETDTATSATVAVVNEQFAKHYWSGQDALGKRFRIDSATGPPVEIVGISKTAKYEWIGEPPTEFVYLPFAQHPRSEMTLLLESHGASADLIEPVRQLVQHIDPAQPVYNVRTIGEFYQKKVVSAPVMIVQTVSVMGMIGLSMALAGLYGLLSYATSRRTREIGIRMALGADANEVVRMVIRQAVVLVFSGITFGLVLAVAVERGLNAVFESSGTDLGAYILTLPSLVVVTLLAALIPAQKASRIQPMHALRQE